MNDTFYCDECHVEIENPRKKKYALCEVCAEECARDFWADLAYEDSRCA